LELSVWVAADPLWVGRVEEVLEAWGGPTVRTEVEGGWRVDVSVGTVAGRSVSAVVVHRSMLPMVVRAQVAVRPEMIEELPRLVEWGAAGLQVIPDLGCLVRMGVLEEDEARVVWMLAEGASNDMICETLGMSRRQTRQLLRDVYRLLGAANKTHAVAYAGRFVTTLQG